LKIRDLARLSIYSLWSRKNTRKGNCVANGFIAWIKNPCPKCSSAAAEPEIIVESTRLPDFPVNDPGDELIVATRASTNSRC